MINNANNRNKKKCLHKESFIWLASKHPYSHIYSIMDRNYNIVFIFLCRGKESKNSFYDQRFIHF